MNYANAHQLPFHTSMAQNKKHAQDGYKDESDNMYFLNRLNHATKRDFIREIEKRKRILAGLTKVNQK